MNTSMKITQLSNSKAKYRANEILRQIPNLDFEANIDVIKHEQINAKFLNKNQKAQRVQLQKNLHIYKKRLAKAIEDGKEKSIKTNTKKIEEIEKQLAKQTTTKGRKKNFLEISLQLTNTHINPSKFDNYNIFYEFVKTNRFTKDLDLKVAAHHRDQNSPHSHFLFDVSNIDNFAYYLREKVDCEINDTREIYSIIQNDFHDFVSKYYDLDEMKKNQEYMSINKYKIFTAKIQKIKNFVDKIKKSTIFEIREHFKFIKETEKMYEAFLNAKNTNNEQLHQKTKKNDLNCNSDCLNDSFEASTSTATKTKKYRNK